MEPQFKENIFTGDCVYTAVNQCVTILDCALFSHFGFFPNFLTTSPFDTFWYYGNDCDISHEERFLILEEAGTIQSYVQQCTSFCDLENSYSYCSFENWNITCSDLVDCDLIVCD
ncbi:MAG: hypothetical protein ACMXYE_01865 [Candidatus Woesearchaeota archaeon]